MSTEPESGPRTLLDKIIFYLGAAGMIGLFGLILYGVGMRYIFNRPPLWSADVPNLLFVWLVFVTVGLTVKLGPQIRVVFFIDKAPRFWRRVLQLLGHGGILVMLAMFIWYSVPIIELSQGQTMLSTGWPGSVFFYALPVGSVVMAYYHGWALIQTVRGRDVEHAEPGR